MRDEKWETVELNQISKIFDCPHSTPNWTDSGVFVIRSWNVRNGRLNFDKSSFTDEKTYLERIRRAKLEFGDLVLTREAPMGEICMVPENLKCCLGQRVVLIKPIQHKVDPYFLLYSFQSSFVQHQIMASEGTGSTVSNLRIPLIESLKITLPDIYTQRRIAAILTALDDKIELNRRMNETLEGIAQAVWGEWFGKYASGEEELPEGWRWGKLSEIAILKNGKTSPERSELENYDVFGSNGVIGKTKEFNSENDTIIIGRVGSYCGSLYLSKYPCWVTDNAIIGKSKIKRSDLFLYVLLKRIDLNNHKTGSGQPLINQNILGNIEIVIPPTQLMQLYNDITQPFYLAIEKNKTQSLTLKTLRDALLPRLMQGELLS